MYLYELPTTGAISFIDVCVDLSSEKAYTRYLPEASQARANLRGVLKDSKRTDHGEKDFLTLVKVRLMSAFSLHNLHLIQVTEEYLPYIQGLINCVSQDEISLKTEPSMSRIPIPSHDYSSNVYQASVWRTTLSANLFNNSPRLSVPGLHADYAFTLLTYAFALSNLAHSVVTSVGNYEQDHAISDADRQAKEERLNVAVDFLCRASGIFNFLSDKVLPEWETSRISPPNFHKPADLTREVSGSLAKFVATSSLKKTWTHYNLL